MSRFKGTGVALVTPFLPSGEIDFDGTKKLLAHTAQGVDYYVVQGTTGESATTTQAEKQALLNFVKENNPHQLPIVFGIGGNHTQEILNQIKAYDLEGVSAVLSVTPYYNKPSQHGMVAHYRAIADHSPVPIILYNVPGRTSSNMKAETTLRLAEHPNIVAMKEASGMLAQTMEISHHKPQDFDLLSGDDLNTVSMIALGANGVISVMANALPVVFKNMVHAALEGNFEKARQQAFSILKLNPMMYRESNPVGVKAALKLMGVCHKTVRLPLLDCSEHLENEIRRELQHMGHL